MKEIRDQWGSKIGFILAAAGSAVGLGNIWKFPYMVGENGGAAFILVYLICVVIVGLPVLLAEILIGRTAQKNPIGSFRELSNQSPFWIAVGGMGILAGFVILSYYNIIAGWCIGYVVESIKGTFSSISNPAQAGEIFQQLSSSAPWTLGFQALFVLLTMSIIYFGVSYGIEKAAKVLMPVLITFIFILVIRGLTLPGAETGLIYLIKPDFSAIDGKTFLMALGQAFFSLSLGMGAMLTYGSYLSKDEDLPKSIFQIVILNTKISLLAGLMFFPAIFAQGLEPQQGPALIFNVLPPLFNSIPAGGIFRVIFFLLLALAALTSTISLMEVITAYFTEEYDISRRKITTLVGIFIFLLGIPSALSFGALSDLTLFGKTFFELSDFFASNILLPLGGILISIFVGWKWGMEKAVPHLLDGANEYPTILLNIWEILVKFVAPVLISFVFIYKLFG